MVIKKQPPADPINTKTTECDVIIFGIQRTVLKISPHCWKRNEEFQASKKKKVSQNLNQYLLSEKEIKDLVQQTNEKEVWFEGINPDWPPWKYYGYNIDCQFSPSWVN